MNKFMHKICFVLVPAVYAIGAYTLGEVIGYAAGYFDGKTTSEKPSRPLKDQIKDIKDINKKRFEDIN